MRVQIAGVSSQEATAFVRQLTPTGSGSDLRFQSTDPAWTLEASVDYVPSTPDRNPYGVVTYRSDRGATASFRLVNELAASYLALPSLGRLQIDDVTVTQHSGGDEMALCGTVDQLTRCVPDQSRWSASSPLSIFEGDLNRRDLGPRRRQHPARTPEHCCRY